MVKTINKYELLLESKEGPQVLVVMKKNIRRIIFRYDDKNNSFRVSAPVSTAQKEIIALFYEKETQILALKAHKQRPVIDNYYYFGKRYNSYQDILGVDYIVTKTEYEKVIRNKFLIFLKTKTAEFERVMNIPLSHKVRIRTMKTRWGTNSLHTRTITYNINLLHFDQKIIEAIIIHELAHYFIGGHQDNFYHLVDQYCPDYKRLAKNLKRGNYANI